MYFNIFSPFFLCRLLQHTLFQNNMMLILLIFLYWMFLFLLNLLVFFFMFCVPTVTSSIVVFVDDVSVFSPIYLPTKNVVVPTPAIKIIIIIAFLIFFISFLYDFRLLFYFCAFSYSPFPCFLCF